MKIQEITSTGQMNFSFENHSFGAAAIAAKRIVNGEIVGFNVFERPNKNDSMELRYKTRFYFGLYEIDGTPAFRVSNCKDLDASGSHSLIASWNDAANDVVFIAARLSLFLTREGSDYFIEESNFIPA